MMRGWFFRLTCAVLLLTGSATQAAVQPASSLVPVVTQLSDACWGQNRAGRRQAPGRRSPSNSQPLAFAEGTKDAAEVERFWSQVRRLQPAKPAAPAGADQPEVAWTVDRAAIGSGPGKKFFALRLAIGNRSSRPAVIPGDSIVLEVDNQPRPLKPLDATLVNYSFSEGGTNIALRECQPPKEIQAPPAGVASAWLIFPEIDGETLSPSIILKFTVNGEAVEIDVRNHQRAVLKMAVEMIGPQQNLALLTIGGTINTFNCQSLVDELDQLVTQQIVRVVIRFPGDAPQLDGQVSSWLVNAMNANNAMRFGNNQFPSFPAQLRELHFVKHPKGNFGNMNPGMGPTTNRFHDTDVDAVAASLRTTYFTVPREQLRQQIMSGHPLSRAAALVHGSHRLAPDDLEVVLPLTELDDAILRPAAIRALREFGEPQALDRLEALIVSDNATDSQTAIDALAESRFNSAAERLQSLLNSADRALQLRVVNRLAASPRPIWSDVLFEHALNEQQQPRMEVLQALVQLDHPQIVDLLEAGLKGTETRVRDFSFQILSHRSDQRSYELAANYVLAKLETGLPDGQMLEFLGRSREPRATALLVSKLELSGEKSAMINTIGQIGDRSAGDRLIAQFESLTDNERVAALNAVRALRHPQFIQVAGKAIGSQHMPLAQTAIQGLMQQGTPQAEALLIETLKNPPRDTILNNVVNALASMRSANARQALVEASQSDNPARKTAGQQGLNFLRQNSPARNLTMQAAQMLEKGSQVPTNREQKEQWKNAAELFQVASELDEFYPEAFSGLGDASLKLERWKDGEAAFRRALELNPNDANSISGLAISEMLLDRPDDALQRILAARPKFEKDAVFLYNVACVYGRGIERLQQSPPGEDVTKRQQEYTKAALTELESAIKLGFRQFDWMQKDPDLKSLRQNADFLRLVKSADNRQSKPEPEDSNQPEADK